MPNVERGVLKPPNEDVRAPISLSIGRGRHASGCRPPDSEHRGDRRGGSADLTELASPV
jgi:hypothetical protein